jgi:hypothetical protein
LEKILNKMSVCFHLARTFRSKDLQEKERNAVQDYFEEWCQGILQIRFEVDSEGSFMSAFPLMDHLGPGGEAEDNVVNGELRYESSDYQAWLCGGCS